jgi:hypothetical protein
MVAPLIGMAARAAAKKAAEKQATRRAQVGSAAATGVAGALGYDKLMSGAKADMEQGAAEGKRRAEKEKRSGEDASEMKRESRNKMKSTSKNGQKLTAQERQMMQEVEDKKNQPKIDEAYEKSRTSLKKGGSVSSASKRADGIAQRGKTRGKVY